jgi:hypothetical protein
MGIVIFILLYFKINKRNSLVQRLLSVSWIILGYKLYLEKSMFDILSNKLPFALGMLSISIGLMLFVNYLEFYKVKEILQKKSLMEMFKSFFNFFFLNQSFGIFDIDKIINYSTNVDINIDPNEESSGYLFKNVLVYIFIAINTFPFLANVIVRNFNTKYFTIPTLYPSPIAISTFTIFLNYFKIYFPLHSKYFFVLNLLCWVYLSLNMIHQCYTTGSISYENVFYLIINLLNLFVIYYFDIFNIHQINKDKANQLLNEARFFNDGLQIIHMPLGDGGTQGMALRQFYIDEFGVIANSFLILSSNGELVEDTSVKQIRSEPKLVRYIYSLY